MPRLHGYTIAENLSPDIGLFCICPAAQRSGPSGPEEKEIDAFCLGAVKHLPPLDASKLLKATLKELLHMDIRILCPKQNSGGFGGGGVSKFGWYLLATLIIPICLTALRSPLKEVSNQFLAVASRGQSYSLRCFHCILLVCPLHKWSGLRSCLYVDLIQSTSTSIRAWRCQ